MHRLTVDSHNPFFKTTCFDTSPVRILLVPALALDSILRYIRCAPVFLPDTVCLHSRASEKVTFFTALKRSLRRLCFHKRLVRGVFASGPGGVFASGPGGVCLWSKGVSASGPEGSFCLWSGGCLPLVQGGVCLWSRGGCLPLVPGEVSSSGLGVV